MIRVRLSCAGIAVFAATLSAPCIALAAGPSTDDASIRQVMLATWDKPESRLDVSPVVVDGGWAIAGWTQGDRGGRALMQRSKHGDWSVVVCGGDGLKHAKTLAMTGMPDATARSLAAALATAEATLPASRLAKFASFEGMVRMSAAGHHPPATSGAQR